MTSTRSRISCGPRFLVAGALLTAGALFAPAKWQEVLGVGTWIGVYRGWIGLAFAVCAVLLLLTILHWAWQLALAKHATLVARRGIKRRLRSLTEEEKKILRYYVLNQTRSNSLRHQDGVVAGLSTAGIIYLASQTGHHFDGFAFNIVDYAWSVLQKEPDLLNGETTEARCDRSAKPWD